MTVDRAFWEPVATVSIRRLAELRAAVLARSEKRMPKWKFRIASDLIIQLQPKLTTGLIKFVGVTVGGANVKASALAKRDRGFPRMGFSLFSPHPQDPEKWALKPHSISMGAYDLRLRTLAVLQDGTFEKLKPELMLHPHCLMCGKALTDPASMARLIGPECAGTSSLNVPGLFDLHAA